MLAVEIHERHLLSIAFTILSSALRGVLATIVGKVRGVKRLAHMGKRFGYAILCPGLSAREARLAAGRELTINVHRSLLRLLLGH
jgi:hypothetical protein